LAASLSGARLHQRPEQYSDLCAGFSSGLSRLPTWLPFFCLPSAPGDGSALNVTRCRAYSSSCSGCRGTFLSTHLAKGLRLCWPLWRPPLTWPFFFRSAPLCVGGALHKRVLSLILFIALTSPALATSGPGCLVVINVAADAAHRDRRLARPSPQKVLPPLCSFEQTEE